MTIVKTYRIFPSLLCYPWAHLTFMLHPKHLDIWWVNMWVGLSRCSQSHKGKTSLATRECEVKDLRKFTLSFLSPLLYITHLSLSPSTQITKHSKGIVGLWITKNNDKFSSLFTWPQVWQHWSLSWLFSWVPQLTLLFTGLNVSDHLPNSLFTDFFSIFRSI